MFITDIRPLFPVSHILPFPVILPSGGVFLSSAASKENFNFQKIVVVVGLALFIIKVAAWYMTHSVAILTDAMESTINIASAFIGLFSLYVSMRPRDLSHLNGHGKIEFLSAGAEGTLITIAGLVIIFEAVKNLIHPRDIGQLDTGIFLVAFTALVNYMVGYAAVRKGKKNKSLALVASGKHLQSDTYSTIGIIIGLFLILVTGALWLDSIVAMLFGAIIIYTGIGILRRSLAGVMDETDIKLLEEVVSVLEENRRDNWIDIHNIRIVKYGSVLHIDCHMTVPWYLNICDVQAETDHLNALIRHHFQENIDLFLQVEACHSSSCHICLLRNCSVRRHSYIQRVRWTAEMLFRDDQHYIRRAGTAGNDDRNEGSS